MENLLLSVNVILPLFLMMALGYVLRVLHVVEEKGTAGMNRLVFKVMLPVMLYYNIYTCDMAQAFDLTLLLYAVAAVAVLFVLLMVLVPRFVADPARRGVMVQAIFRSNFVIFGLPVTAALFGEGNTGTTAMLIAVVVPIFNIMAVICLEWFRGGRVNYKKIALNIAKNPLVIAAVLAFLTLLCRLRLPTAVESFISSLSKCTTPLGLLVLGAGFHFAALKQNRAALCAGVVLKLVVVPAAAVCFGALVLGLRAEALAAILILFGAPCAVSSYNMAREMQGDAELAGQMVVLTSIASVLSMFFWIYLLRTLGWL